MRKPHDAPMTRRDTRWEGLRARATRPVTTTRMGAGKGEPRRKAARPATLTGMGVPPAEMRLGQAGSCGTLTGMGVNKDEQRPKVTSRGPMTATDVPPVGTRLDRVGSCGTMTKTAVSPVRQDSDPSPAAGWIYVLSHPQSKGRVKIGFSKKEPTMEGGRVRDLTFLIRAFELGEVEVFQQRHQQARIIERAIIRALRTKAIPHIGPKDSRETFDFGFDLAKKMVNEAVEAFGTSNWDALVNKWSSEIRYTNPD